MPTIRLRVLHAAQQEIHDTAKRFNVLMCGRRFGKSDLGENLAAETILAGGPVGWFAPNWKHMYDVWDWAVRTFAPVTKRVNSTERRLHLTTGGVWDFWSLEDPEAGRSRRYKRAIIDEAALVRTLKKSWENAIRPTLTDLKGDAWFFSTPAGYGDFNDLFEKGQDPSNARWKSWRKRSIDNPFLSKSEIAEAEKELPPRVFAQEYLGVPDDDAGNPFGLSHIRECTMPLSIEAPQFWGWDLGKSEDFTVGIGLDVMGRTAGFARFQKPWRETIQAIRSASGERGGLVDSTGVGDPILEELVRGHGAYEGFKFTAQSKQQIMEGLALAIQQGVISFPEGPITSELRTFRYEYRPGGGVRYSAPEGMHDDCVCALALAWHRKNTGVLAGDAQIISLNSEQSAYHEIEVMLGDTGDHRKVVSVKRPTGHVVR